MRFIAFIISLFLTLVVPAQKKEHNNQTFSKPYKEKVYSPSKDNFVSKAKKQKKKRQDITFMEKSTPGSLAETNDFFQRKKKLNPLMTLSDPFLKPIKVSSMFQENDFFTGNPTSAARAAAFFIKWRRLN